VIRAAVVLGALVLAATASGGALPARGRAIIGGTTVQLRYAAAFPRTAPDGSSGGYAIILAAKPVRCNELYHLPDQNRLGTGWALVSLYPTKDGAPPTGKDVHGEIDYPVEDAYASLARGVSIALSNAAPVRGSVWRGRAVQGARKVEGKMYALNVTFAARWCP
jgi:hypothetical protein